MFKKKREKLACFHTVQGGGILLSTQLSGSHFYGGKILTQSECFWWLGSEKGQKTEESETACTTFFFFH